jgi:hypothetical protein
MPNERLESADTARRRADNHYVARRHCFSSLKHNWERRGRDRLGSESAITRSGSDRPNTRSSTTTELAHGVRIGRLKCSPNSWIKQSDWACAGTTLIEERCSAMTQEEFDSAESWSVTYRGLVYDNARKVDCVWFYRDPATKLILRFALQDRVTPLHKNIPTSDK